MVADPDKAVIAKEFLMKKTLRFIGITALAAVISFGVTGCDTGTGGAGLVQHQPQTATPQQVPEAYAIALALAINNAFGHLAAYKFPRCNCPPDIVGNDDGVSTDPTPPRPTDWFYDLATMCFFELFFYHFDEDIGDLGGFS